MLPDPGSGRFGSELPPRHNEVFYLIHAGKGHVVLVLLILMDLVPVGNVAGKALLDSAPNDIYKMNEGDMYVVRLCSGLSQCRLQEAWWWRRFVVQEFLYPCTSLITRHCT